MGSNTFVMSPIVVAYSCPIVNVNLVVMEYSKYLFYLSIV